MTGFLGAPAAYGASQGGLNGGPADVSNRTLHEIYLRPWLFMGSVGMRSAMASHNTVNDIPAHGNEWLIQTALRRTFNFSQGVVLSDCNDIGVLADFGYARNGTEAAALGLKAGVDWDLQCGTNPDSWSYNKLGDVRFPPCYLPCSPLHIPLLSAGRLNPTSAPSPYTVSQPP